MSLYFLIVHVVILFAPLPPFYTILTIIALPSNVIFDAPLPPFLCPPATSVRIPEILRQLPYIATARNFPSNILVVPFRPWPLCVVRRRCCPFDRLDPTLTVQFVDLWFAHQPRNNFNQGCSIIPSFAPFLFFATSSHVNVHTFFYDKSCNRIWSQIKKPRSFTHPNTLPPDLSDFFMSVCGVSLMHLCIILTFF